MTVSQELPSEFLVVLRADSEESFAKVNQTIESLLQDEHIDVINPRVVDLDTVRIHNVGDKMLDISDDEQVKRLIESAPPESREQVKDAIALLRALDNSLQEIGQTQKEVATSSKQMNDKIDQIRAKVVNATQKSREELAKLGF